MKEMNALIVHGGWQGHQPSGKWRRFLRACWKRPDSAVEVSDSLDAFKDKDKLLELDLIVPIWTMGKITGEQLDPVCEAVRSGVGIAGCHGGMCDSFREATEWQFMTGGQWIAHPGNDGTPHRIFIRDHDHAITQGIADFDVRTEQYYLLVDPAVHVLAVTPVPHRRRAPCSQRRASICRRCGPNATAKAACFIMPWGIRHVNIVAAEPNPTTSWLRGFLWAAAGKNRAQR